MSVNNVSIHPRVWHRGEKKNTSKPRSTMKLERALKGIERHLETNPHDSMSRARVAAINNQLRDMMK